MQRFENGLIRKIFFDKIKNVDLHKEAFDMLDFKTVDILKDKW